MGMSYHGQNIVLTERTELMVEPLELPLSHTMGCSYSHMITSQLLHKVICLESKTVMELQ